MYLCSWAPGYLFLQKETQEGNFPFNLGTINHNADNVLPQFLVKSSSFLRSVILAPIGQDNCTAGTDSRTKPTLLSH